MAAIRTNTLRLAACTLLAAVLVFQSAPVPAAPAPSNPQIVKAKAEADRIRRHIDDLAADAEGAEEDYAAASAALAKTRSQVTQAQDELNTANAELDQAQARLDRRVQGMYRGGRMSFIAVLLGASDFSDFASRVEVLRRIAVSDAAVVAEVTAARNKARKLSSTLANRKADQVVLLQRAEQRKGQVQDALDSQRTYLAKVDSNIQKLIAQERAEQQRKAEEQARRLAAQEKARREAAARAARVAAARRAAARRSANAADPSDSSASDPEPASASGSHLEALAVAKKFIGVTPYLWGGTTPAGFDCSGLTQYAYRQVGISIPRTSRSQFTIGTHISRNRLDLLQPGDLVFFGRNGDASLIHHVGMYAGDGMFVHAPQTGMKVSLASLTARIRDRGDYVGAVRP